MIALHVMESKVRNIGVFCGAANGKNPRFAEETARLGQDLAKRAIGVVYGGGNVGLMGVLADSTLEAHGAVTGVIPRLLVDREVAHRGLSTLYEVNSMSERKELIAELSDAFIALPGGLGTLDELFEMLTWVQLGLATKPIGILNVDNYFAPLLNFFSSGAENGLIPPATLKLLHVENSVETLVDRLVQPQSLIGGAPCRTYEMQQ